METARLTEELIPEVTRGGNDALVRQLQAALARAEEQDQAVYVHYEPQWLQWVVVDLAHLDDPETQERLHSHAWWNDRIGVMLPILEE